MPSPSAGPLARTLPSSESATARKFKAAIHRVESTCFGSCRMVMIRAEKNIFAQKLDGDTEIETNKFFEGTNSFVLFFCKHHNNSILSKKSQAPLQVLPLTCAEKYTLNSCD